MTKAQLAKKYLLQNYVFKYVAIAMGVCGFIVFISMYQTYIGGEVINFIKRPTLVPIMMIPFLPAMIFLLLSKKARTKATNLLSAEPEQKAAPAKK